MRQELSPLEGTLCDLPHSLTPLATRHNPTDYSDCCAAFTKPLSLIMQLLLAQPTRGCRLALGQWDVVGARVAVSTPVACVH